MRTMSVRFFPSTALSSRFPGGTTSSSGINKKLYSMMLQNTFGMYDDLLKKEELRLTTPMVFDGTYKPGSKRIKHFRDYCMELTTELFEYNFLLIPDDEVGPPGKRKERAVDGKR